MLVKIAPVNHGADLGLGLEVSHGHPVRLVLAEMDQIHQMENVKVNLGHLARMEWQRMALNHQMKNVQAQNLLRKMDIAHGPVRRLRKDDQEAEVGRAEVVVVRSEAIVGLAEVG